MIPQEELRRINQALGIASDDQKRYVIYPDADSHWHLAVAEGIALAPGGKKSLSALSKKRVGINKTIDASERIMKGEIIIGKTDSELSKERTANFLKDLINKKGLYCFYVTFNRSSITLLKSFKKKRIKTKNIHFFDAVTRLSTHADSDEVFSFIDSPKHLEYLLIFIKRQLDLIEGKKAFLVLDTLTNLLDCNTREEAISFTQALINKLRLVNIGGILIDVSSGADATHNFKKFADFSIVI
jgi:hypothetical protein